MLGPLPPLHRRVIIAVALAVFVGLGLWAGAVPSIPVLVNSGATIGVGVGMIAAWLLVHEPHRQTARLARHTRTHHR